MGLTLHYKLRAPSVTGEEAARALATRMRAAALAMKQAGPIEKVGAISSSPAQLAWLSELRRTVERMNGIVAAFAGAVKDATEDSGGAPVQSPIFAHPQFERIEAEGMAREGRMVRKAVPSVRQARP